MTNTPHVLSKETTVAAAGTAGERLYSEFEGDPDMIDLVRMFVDEMPGRVSELTESMRKSELEKLKRYAHQLKGAGGGYGFADLSTAAGKLEAAVLPLLGPSAGSGAQKSLEGLKVRVEELVELCGRVAVR